MNNPNSTLTFWDLYEAWERRATAQARQMYPTGHVEVCEDGSVYLGNMTWLEADTVERWPGVADDE